MDSSGRLTYPVAGEGEGRSRVAGARGRAGRIGGALGHLGELDVREDLHAKEVARFES